MNKIIRLDTGRNQTQKSPSCMIPCIRSAKMSKDNLGKEIIRIAGDEIIRIAEDENL